MLYREFLKLITPLVKWIAGLYVPFSRKKVTGKHYYKVRDEITPGTVLLTTTYGEFSNLINPIDIKHAGIYIGKDSDGICYVSEALGRGVVKTDLVTFMTTKDVVVGVKPKFLTPSDKHELPKEAKKLIGMPYDYLFEGGNKALYCFENVITVFKSLRPELQYKCTEIVKGKKIYDYKTFLEDENLFTVLFDSRKMSL